MFSGSSETCGAFPSHATSLCSPLHLVGERCMTHFPLAGFQVALIGQFWVTLRVHVPQQPPEKRPYTLIYGILSGGHQRYSVSGLPSWEYMLPRTVCDGQRSSTTEAQPRARTDAQGAFLLSSMLPALGEWRGAIQAICELFFVHHQRYSCRRIRSRARLRK